MPLWAIIAITFASTTLVYSVALYAFARWWLPRNVVKLVSAFAAIQQRKMSATVRAKHRMGVVRDQIAEFDADEDEDGQKSPDYWG